MTTENSFPQTLTLIANPANPVLTPRLAQAICDALTANDTINTLKPDWLAEGIACDIPLPTTTSTPRRTIAEVLGDQPVDFVIQNALSRQKKALIADMDSTMIQQECIDELAAEAGIKDKVSAITARAMNGEIEFEAALNQRMQLLSGLNTSVIADVIATRITLTPGAQTLIATMKSNGAYCALVSGGFTAFTKVIAAQLGFDENRANILLEEGGELTGKVAQPILGQQAKVDALNDIAETHNLTSEDFIAVGDGANDLGMLGVAGTGVALHAKPSVAAQAEFRIDHGDLTALLYIQGYKQSEFIE